ncbi:SCAMP-like protein [Cynara cardunculus var. scolymus]|uniref:Secretory carrier-associated membrane protein n=1 Tax=Cynara cardunculus var. scolymus TaxID=59895 RepID=A0A103XU14_CYNCS|nr:SCAMP-like protein [Cynara cardunculus var. scolymus]
MVMRVVTVVGLRRMWAARWWNIAVRIDDEWSQTGTLEFITLQFVPFEYLFEALFYLKFQALFGHCVHTQFTDPPIVYLIFSRHNLVLMAGRFDPNPFDDGDEVNPFASVPSAPNSRLSPLPHEPADFYNRNDSVDIPLDSAADLKKKERELQAREADLRRREEIVKRKEEAAARAGIVLEEKNWPPFFPIIHHDIPSEIPIHLQKLQYVAFTTYLGMWLVFCLFWNIIATTTAWIKGEVAHRLCNLCRSGSSRCLQRKISCVKVSYQPLISWVIKPWLGGRAADMRRDAV